MNYEKKVFVATRHKMGTWRRRAEEAYPSHANIFSLLEMKWFQEVVQASYSSIEIPDLDFTDSEYYLLQQLRALLPAKDAE